MEWLLRREQQCLRRELIRLFSEKMKEKWLDEGVKKVLRVESHREADDQILNP